MKLILVRHTTLNIKEGICYGQFDVLPAETFDEEATLVKKKLEYYKPNLVYTSPLQRCTLLATACHFEKAVRDNRLLELNFGNWELLRWENIHGEYVQKWMKDYLIMPTPNGECLQDLIDRIHDFLLEMKQSGHKQVLCFTHSGPIRVFAHLIDKTPIEKLFEFVTDYGGIYEFEI